MDYTEKNRELVVACLREFCKQEDWRHLHREADKALKKSKLDDKFLKRLPNVSTLYRLAKGEILAKDMRESSFRPIVWMLNYYKFNNWESQEQSYVDLLKERAQKINQTPKAINPESSFVKSNNDQFIGQYQGYRWSVVNNEKMLDLFRLVIDYDKENDALISEETVYNSKTKIQEVLKGTLAVSVDNQDISYIVARKKRESAITGLQFTIIFSYERGIDGKVTQMNGSVFWQADNGHFVRDVLFYRHNSPEIDLISPNNEDAQIVRVLNKIQIDRSSRNYLDNQVARLRIPDNVGCFQPMMQPMMDRSYKKIKSH